MYDYTTNLKLDGRDLIYDVECTLEAEITDENGCYDPYVDVTAVWMGGKHIPFHRRDMWGEIARHIRDEALKDKKLFETVAAHDGWFLREDGEWYRVDYRAAAE